MNKNVEDGIIEDDLVSKYKDVGGDECTGWDDFAGEDEYTEGDEFVGEDEATEEQ